MTTVKDAPTVVGMAAAAEAKVLTTKCGCGALELGGRGSSSK